MSAKAVAKAAKLRGLTVQKAGVTVIAQAMESEPEPLEALSVILDKIKEHLDANRSGAQAGSIVTEATVLAVVADLSKEEADVDQERFQLLNAFDTPKLSYDPGTKRFTVSDVRPGLSLHAGPQAKVAMLRERFLLVQQRVQRNDMFCKPLLAGAGGGSSSHRSYIELATVDSLLGSAGGVTWLLGMLCEVEEGCFHLEDLNAHVPIDLSQTVTTPGLFTENCIVLAEGQLVDGVFVVQQLGFPPPQQRLDSLDAVGGSWDLFRTGVTPAQWLKVQALEHAAADSMFVVVSDVHLDVPLVLDKLRAMLAGFCTVQPLPLFVLLGDFTARPVGFGKDGAAQLASHFKALANLIAEFPALASEGRFVLVPGPNDPGAGATLPRAPLASHFTAALRERVPHASFATNPCRLRFYAQEIVIFREDVLKKMTRHCLFEPRSTPDAPMDVTEHLVKTVLDQGHLCPLPLASRPIHWQYDHALRLWPMPDLLVLADRTDQYSWRYEDCLVLNPGQFTADFSFVVYRPASFETEFSRV